MKKTLLLMIALLIGISGAWAQTYTVTVCDNTKTIDPNFGTFSDKLSHYGTLTTKPFDGENNLLITSEDKVLNENYWSSYKYCLTVNGGSDNTYTIRITAPEGYRILSYSLGTMKTTTSTNSTLACVTAEDGTTTGNFSTGGKTLSVTGVNAKTTYFEVKTSTTSSSVELAIATMSVVVIPEEVANATASITENHIYRIFTKNNGSAEGDTKYYLTSTGTLTTNLASAGAFYLNATTSAGYVPAGYAWKMLNGSTRFTNRPYNTPGQTQINTTSGNNRDTYEAQVLYLNGSGKYAVRSTNNASSGSAYAENSYWNVIPDATGDDVPDATYDDQSMGTKHYVWQLEEVASITYNLIYGGDVLASITLDRASNIGTAALPLDSWNIPYCTYSYSPETITAETETENITMTWEGPFEFSSDFASATWYNMSLRNKWAAYSTSGTPYPLYSTKSDATSQTRESMWAFVGDPYNGVRVINRKAGNGYYLSSYTSYTSNVGDALMDTYADEYTLWAIGTNNNGFTLHCGVKYLYDASNQSKLRIYNGSAAGAPGETAASLAVSSPSYCDLALAYLDDYADSHAVGNYFGLKEDVVNSLRGSFETAGDGITETVYNNVAKPAVEALWPGEDNANVNYPPTGQYWIRSYGRTNPYRYMQIDNSGKPITTTTKNEIGNVVTLTALANHKYKIQMQGLCLDAPTYSGDFLDMTASEAGVEFDTQVAAPAEVGFKSGNEWNFIHPRNNGTYGLMCYWGPSSDAASGWVVEDATNVSIPLNYDGSAYSYGTMYLPFGATITGAKAYILTVSGEWAIPTEIAEVPANTGVLIRAEGEATSVTANIKNDAAAETTDNELVGTFTDITAARTAGEYILGNGSAGIGFYQRGSEKKIGANKAYLSLGADLGVSGVKGIRWDIVDGIEAIAKGQEPKANSQIFNLAGQRMSKLQRGVNIVNGKKVLVK